MTEEEYFRKNYPNSCYGDKPLSPHWDFFQDGVEFGERQSEKRIEELLERLLITSCNSDVLNQYPNCSEVLKVRCEAEQFLKGEADETKNLFTTKELVEQLVKIAEEPNSVSQGWFQIVMSEAKQFLKDESKSKWVNPVRTTNDNKVKL